MTNFSKKFCAKSPFKFGGVFGNILRIAPKTSTANVTSFPITGDAGRLIVIGPLIPEPDVSIKT